MRDIAADLDLIDVADLSRVREFEGRGRNAQDHDPRAPAGAVGLQLGKSHHVAVEGERGVEILGLQDQAELCDGHASSLEPGAPRAPGRYLRLFCISTVPSQRPNLNPTLPMWPIFLKP